jgi:hypothetical protein
MIWTLILTANISVYLAGLTNFDCGYTEFDNREFEMGLTAGVTGQQRMLTPPRHLILPSHLSEVRVALYSIL